MASRKILRFIRESLGRIFGSPEESRNLPSQISHESIIFHILLKNPDKLAMQHSTFSIKQGKYSYFAQLWRPQKVDASLVIVHGQSDHSSRYTHVAEYLCQYNIAMVGIDLYGHGKSKGKRGHVPEYEVLLESVEATLKWTQKEFPNEPSFLYGHSMGGNIVANYVLRFKPQIRGSILTGPYFRLAFEPSPAKVLLAKSVVKLMPSMTQATGLDPNGLSHDTEVVEAYKKDKWVHGMISPVAFLSLVENGEWAIKNSSRWEGSLLIMHGEEDPITSFDASKEFIANIDRHNQDVTFKAWEGFYHEIHNELGKEEVLTFLKDWITKRT